MAFTADAVDVFYDGTFLLEARFFKFSIYAYFYVDILDMGNVDVFLC